MIRLAMTPDELGTALALLPDAYTWRIGVRDDYLRGFEAYLHNRRGGFWNGPKMDGWHDAAYYGIPTRRLR